MSLSSPPLHPTEICCHQLFEQQVQQNSDHTAIICHNQQLTYAELNAQANQLAHHLIVLGAKPETLIPICVDRSAAMAIGILGILKSGAAFVPIDPAYPSERIEFMLADTAAPIFITQSQFIPQLPKINTHIVALDRDAAAIAQYSTANPNVNLDGENLSYVIYTSGSTGKPKGTMLTQTNLSHYALALQAELQITPADRYLHLASLAFSSARRHLLFPLAHGATVVIADEELRLDALPLFALVKNSGVTIFDAVPSFQRHCTNALLELPEAKRANLLANNIRLFLSASEPLLSDIPRIWINEFRHPARHVHMMGQTETSGIIALHRISEQDINGQTKVVPIGHPIKHTNIFLLDEQQQPIPAGTAGEIYVSSLGVGRGYLNRPDLSKEKFLAIADYGLRIADLIAANPQSAIRNLQLCKTGDFARQLPDGTFECLGRQDFQVKIRGFRVELGEIEARLISHKKVREAVVIARKEGERKYLAAYIVPREQSETLQEELRNLAIQELPDYMVPAMFVFLSALPLTPNGKVDRKALPIPDESNFAAPQNYVAPRNPTEAAIAAIWSEVLGIEQIGIHEHFFALGGHSLLASQIVARLRSAFKIALSLRTFFAAPTITGLAEKISLGGNETTATPNITKAASLTNWPLSFAQQRLWFLDQLEPETATYNLSKLVRLHGAIDVKALHAALQIVVARHDALRTSFVTSGEQVGVKIHANLTLDLPRVDLSQRPHDVQKLTANICGAPFDLSQAPLLRMQLIKLSANEHQLIIAFHHIISDGWSVGIFLQELGAAYQAIVTGKNPALPTLPIQYCDYAVWQHEFLQGEFLQEQLQFWRTHLADAPSLLELPTDFLRPAVQRYRGAQISAPISAELTTKLRALSQRENVTLFMTLLSAWQILLARYSGQEQIVVGTPIAGRAQIETENLLGFFVNTLALRGNLTGNPSFQELLARTRIAALDAYAHQDLPFEKLVEELQPERSLSHSPIFQVMFALQNVPRIAEQWGEIRLSFEKLLSTTAKFDLSLDVYEIADGLTAQLEFDTDLFTSETAARILQHWQNLLAAIVADPAQAMQNLPLLSAQEQQQMLVEWNQTTVEIPPVCVQQLIEAQAAAHPENIAVVWQAQKISYQELNERANQLAHYLREQNVCAENIVGICLERSIEMIVAVLAVLKSGGAYLPLDPNYPSERLTHMLEDAQVKVLLTHEALLPALPTATTQTIYVNREAEIIAQHSCENPTTEIQPNNLAYVIYTSGSTGKSKGVQVTHRNVVNAFAAWNAAYELPRLNRHLQMASFSFDVFTGDFTRALCSGATLVLCPSENLLEPEKLFALLQTEKIRAAEFVPAVARPLMDYLEESGQTLEFMQLVVVGSDVWQAHEYRRLQTLCGPQTRVINSYGVTEATIDSTFFEASEITHEGQVPIGKPFPNTQIYILDAQLQPVPIGVTGELYIGGAGVARGYLNRPQLTQEKFIAIADYRFGSANPISANPQSAIPTPQLYRTGDLARFRSDGTIELLGRADAQVKLRGFRIELGEIETALKQYSQVKDAVAVVREDDPNDKRLVAYIVSQTEISSSVLREYLQASLPAQMIPSTFVILEKIPLTPNGKVDRKALPQPDENKSEHADDFVAPRNIIEEKVAEVWAATLKCARVSVTDNFFALGGHSLLATKIMARLRSEFQIELPLRVLFEAPTVAEIALAIDKQLAAQPDDELAAILAELEAMPEEDVQMLLAQENIEINELRW